MSGFEVLGLACNIFQTLSFAHETAKICIDLYRGQKSPDADIQEMARSMAETAKKVTDMCRNNKALDKDIAKITSGCQNCVLDKEIAHIAKTCTDIASQLESEVGKITSLETSGNLLLTLKARSKSLWKKTKLEDLNKSLGSCRAQMQTLLITQIWVTIKDNNLTRDPNFANRGADVRDFISNLENGHTKVEDLLKRHAASTQAHITDEFGRAKQDIKAHNEDLWQTREKEARKKAKYERLRKSFEFSDMNSRRNAILDPRDATFGRIFQSYRNTINRVGSSDTRAIDAVWQSFVDWLRSDEPMFWIQGKPGAGKSTLMKYIIEHEETQELLNQWCPKTLILSHYFWKIGSAMESNLLGLYCALIHQLMDENELMMARILNEFPYATKKTFVNDWSAHELGDVLNYILGSRANRQPLCIFIDGLDEYDGLAGQRDFIRKMKGLAQHGRVKLCVSSRPEERLRESLSTTPNLRLDELTRPDMESNIQERLGVFEHRGQISFQTLQTMANLIIQKAEGVFLWLHLTMQSIENGIENEDSDEDLITRLENLPRDIEDLYEDMWRRVNQDQPVYREPAALFFLCLIHFPELQRYLYGYRRSGRLADNVFLLDMVCWKDRTLQETILEVECEISTEEIARVCERAEKEIRIRCAGLVEVRKTRSDDTKIDTIFGSVDFVHRTAHDFLVDTAAGQKILSYGKLSTMQIATQLAKGAFCRVRVEAAFGGNRSVTDAMNVLDWLQNTQNWLDGPTEWLAMAERFYEAGLIKARWVPRPSFLGHVAWYPEFYGAAMPLFEKAEPSEATELLIMIIFVTWPEERIKASGAKAALQLLSRGPDLAAAGAYVADSSWQPVTAKRTTVLWKFGLKFLHRDLGWRKYHQTIEPTFAEAVAAVMSQSTNLRLEQWGLVAPVLFSRIGGWRPFTLSKIPQRLELGQVIPFFELNTAFLIKHTLDGILIHYPDKMTAQLHKIHDQIANPIICVYFIGIGTELKDRWFRVIDQTPLQGISDLIFSPTTPLHDTDKRLGQWHKSVFDVVFPMDNTVLEEVEFQDVLRAPADEGRLGPCRLQDAGLEWSREMREVVEIEKEHLERPPPSKAWDEIIGP
ncbi:unnamed protein product [Clonostachys rosea]|uniref:NACHT domain-containing protein n=1 Tax=Bionectria ochroleuca TaxID=29856 RepID=A0ABY6TW34_BIOOC|nr:unnamed protein product [Clonostachys rosea]